MKSTFGTAVVASPGLFEVGRLIGLSPDAPPQERTLGRTSIAPLMPLKGTVRLGGTGSETMTLSARPAETIEQTLFDALVGLKVSVSLYAMHLAPAARHNIFAQLDAIINPDDWHEGDDLPNQAAFQEFLKWLIYAKCFDWTSLGVSDEGHILVAWHSAQLRLTANFSGLGDVRWTATLHSDSGVEHAAGKSSLKFFEKQARFYLKSE